MILPIRKLGLIFCISLGLAACANQKGNHAIYDMIDSRNCIEEVGYPNCNPDKMEYQQYKTERDAIKRGE